MIMMKSIWEDVRYLQKRAKRWMTLGEMYELKGNDDRAERCYRRANDILDDAIHIILHEY